MLQCTYQFTQQQSILNPHYDRKLQWILKQLIVVKCMYFFMLQIFLVPHYIYLFIYFLQKLKTRYDENPNKYKTLNAMILDEIEQGTTKRPHSATDALLWLTRYVLRTLHLLLWHVFRRPIFLPRD